ncbi:MAG TPA: transposase, partial [Clostridia bacterium]|nr:transposase [Clostridia bacterium]
MQNRCLYSTDLTDEQWELLQRVLPRRQKTTKRGRPPADLRRICNGLLYLVRSGCAWNLLPREFGPYKTVYHYFWLWTKQGYWTVIHDCLRDAVRAQAGKRRQPTAAILDSQTVRSADQAGER